MARRRRARPHRPPARSRQAVLGHHYRKHAPPLDYKVRPEFGERFAGDLTEMDWQRWIDQLTRQGLSRSSIAQLVSLASGIYAWAAAPSRRLVQCNPLRLVELPPNYEKPRMRVALAPEAAALLAALEPEDRLPCAIAFYVGLRRSELYRLEWRGQRSVIEAWDIESAVIAVKLKFDVLRCASTWRTYTSGSPLGWVSLPAGSGSRTSSRAARG